MKLEFRQEDETQANNYKAMQKVMNVKGGVHRVEQSTFIGSFYVPDTVLNK